jgi:hypothetical protein
MKTMKQSVIEAMTNEQLQAEIGKFEASYNSSAIEFKNSKGLVVACPANLIKPDGSFAGDKESDKASFDTYISVYLKVKHEADKAKNGSASVSSGKETLTIRTCSKGIEFKQGPVSTQWHAAQALAKTIHKLRAELEARTNAEKQAKVNADMNDYVASLQAPIGWQTV